jgi:hypothetical protein
MFSGLMIALPITFVIGLAEFMGTRGVVVAWEAEYVASVVWAAKAVESTNVAVNEVMRSQDQHQDMHSGRMRTNKVRIGPSWERKIYNVYCSSEKEAKKRIFHYPEANGFLKRGGGPHPHCHLPQNGTKIPGIHFVFPSWLNSRTGIYIWGNKSKDGHLSLIRLGK